MQGIVIATSEKTKDFLKPLLDSLPTEYPVLVVGNARFKNEYVNVVNPENEFECGALRRGKERFDEFVFLMDTCLVKDKNLFKKVFAMEGSVFFMEKFRSYLGKYESKHLTDIPRIKDKRGAVWAESNWLEDVYKRRSKAKPFDQLMPHATNNIKEINGEMRCVIENDYLIKYKAYWGQKKL